MTYSLKGVSGDSRWEATIPEDEFNRIVKAKDGVLEVLYLEEKFDLLMENYFEYERELLTSALRYLIFSNQILEQLQDARLSVTRKLQNVLSTCRLYLDQSVHHIRQALGDSSTIEVDHAAARSKEYDSSLSFRVLEELRNHAQHRGYPFHIITFDSRLTEPELGAPSMTCIIPKLSVKKLQQEGGFKPRVIEELIGLGQEEIDLRPHVRKYIDSLQTIQSKLRSSLDDVVEKWISVLFSARRELISEDTQTNEESIWLLEFISDPGEGSTEDTYFAFSSIERYRSFKRKNSAGRPLSSRFVSSQVDLPSA